MTLPSPFIRRPAGGGTLVARPEMAEAAVEAVIRAGSLCRWAERRPDALRLEGRGAVWAVPVEGREWVVRHYRRGGWVARILGDRYFRWGEPRPVREVRLSEAARSRGVDTPLVLAAALYPAGLLFYRADLVTERIPDSVDLARALFGRSRLSEPGGAEEGRGDAAASRARTPATAATVPTPDGEPPAEGEPAADEAVSGRAALSAAARLVDALATAGIRHRDVNAKNVLLRREVSGGLRPYILDLDSARLADPADPKLRPAMLNRLTRSLRKWERESGRLLSPEEWTALRGSRDGAGGETTPRGRGEA